MGMLGTDLRAHRKTRKLTLEAVSAKCGLSYRTVWNLEQGRGTYSCLEKLLKSFALEVAGRNLPSGEHLGQQLQILRQRRKMSLEAVCQVAGISKAALHSLETKGVRQIAIVEKVSAVLGAGLYLKPVADEKSFYTHAGNSSGQNFWRTPAWVVEALTSVFGVFDLDPCTYSRRTNGIARVGFIPEDNGLELAWFGQVFVNPPYGRELTVWIEKMVREATAPKVSLLVGLVPARTDTKWWHLAVKSGATIVFLKGRLKFGDGQQSAPFPSALLLWKLPPLLVSQIGEVFPESQIVEGGR